MEIIDFKSNEKKAIHTLLEQLDIFFWKDTLVINDTRWMIIPQVLPFIEFVCTYDQRILPILKNTNVIFTYPFDEKVLEYYLNLWLSDWVNIILTENIKECTLAKNIAWNEDLLTKIQSYNFTKIVPFFVNNDMKELSEKIWIKLHVTQEIFEKANNKLLLKKHLLQVWLPTIDWDFTNEKDIISHYFQKEERYLFKDPLWVSWYWFWDNKENTLDELLENYKNKDLIIERFIDKKDSPSIQFFISEDRKTAIIFWLTDQILENWKIYVGNVSPSEYIFSTLFDEILAQSKEIITYISNIWYNWFWGIDFIIDTNDNVYATEVNARFTWATYPAITSMLLHNNLFTQWEFTNYEWEKEDVKSYLMKKSIKKVEDKWIFPLWLSWIEKFWKANLLIFK